MGSSALAITNQPYTSETRQTHCHYGFPSVGALQGEENIINTSIAAPRWLVHEISMAASRWLVDEISQRSIFHHHSLFFPRRFFREGFPLLDGVNADEDNDSMPSLISDSWDFGSNTSSACSASDGCSSASDGCSSKASEAEKFKCDCCIFDLVAAAVIGCCITSRAEVWDFC